MKQLTAITALWGRPNITRIMAAGVDRLRESGYNVRVFAGVSNRADQDLAEELGFIPVPVSNSQLGNKWNAVISEAMRHEWPYLVQLGSDDLISDELVRSGIEAMEQGEGLAGVKELYFIDSYTLRASKWRYETEHKNLAGAGRFISRAVAEAHVSSDGYCRLWPHDAKKGLDGHSQASAEAKGFSAIELQLSRPGVVDIKSATNIWKFGRFYHQDFAVPTDEALWFAGETEKQLLGYGGIGKD